VLFFALCNQPPLATNTTAPDIYHTSAFNHNSTRGVVM
jgi:hypothetical protein